MSEAMMTCGYSQEQNDAVKAAQKVAYRRADELCPPMPGMTQADFDQEWIAHFDRRMQELGFKYTGDHCMCDDPERGHEPACGWSNAEGRS